MNDEIRWKKIPGYSNYEISDHGSVRKSLDYIRPVNDRKNLCAGQFLKLTLTPWGYYIVRIKGNDGIIKAMCVHVLVTLNFIGPRPFNGAMALHGDDNKLNNHYTNLRWGTYADNIYDAIRNNKRNKRPNNAKLSNDEIKNVHSMYQNGYKYKEISELYKVHPETIGRIIRGNFYKDSM